jgi:hypothetical protein
MITPQVRTNNNLLGLPARGESPAWVVSPKKEPKIAVVHVVNWDGSQRIEAAYDRAKSERRDDGRLIVRFSDARIMNCKVRFTQNPVRYING